MTTAKRKDKSITRMPTSSVSELTGRLGYTLRDILENRISPQHARFSSIINAWHQLVPAELAQHCKVIGLSGAALRVLVDSPVYMYELKLCSSELLNKLQRQYPQARIRKIELAVG